MTKPDQAIVDAPLPCPHCDSKDIRFDKHYDSRSPTGEIWSMCCYGCGAMFPNRHKKSLLLKEWNTRASQTAREEAIVKATIERCAAACGEIQQKYTEFHAITKNITIENSAISKGASSCKKAISQLSVKEILESVK